jgi:hypothetical protein
LVSFMFSVLLSDLDIYISDDTSQHCWTLLCASITYVPVRGTTCRRVKTGIARVKWF